MMAVGTLHFSHICENFVISCCEGAGAVAIVTCGALLPRARSERGTGRTNVFANAGLATRRRAGGGSGSAGSAGRVQSVLGFSERKPRRPDLGGKTLERPRRVSPRTTQDAAHPGRGGITDAAHAPRAGGRAARGRPRARPRARRPRQAPREKRSEDQGVQKVSRREGRGGTRRSRRGRSRRGNALGRGARAAARPRRRGLAERVARRARPSGEAPSVASRPEQARRPPPPSGAFSEPIGAGRHVLVGDPIVVPSRRAAAGDVARGPRIRASRAARGTTRAPSDFRRDPPSRRKSATRRRALSPPSLPPRVDTPPWRPCASPRARRCPSRRPSRRPTRRARVRSRAATTPPSARAYSPRAGRPPPPTSPAPRRVPRGGPQTSVLASAPPSASQFPALVDSFTQAFRVLQALPAALIRAHAEKTETRRRSAPRRRRGAPPLIAHTPTPRLCSRCSTRTGNGGARDLGNAAYRRDGARFVVHGERGPLRTERSERNARRRAREPGPGCRFAAAQAPPSAPSRRRR